MSKHLVIYSDSPADMTSLMLELDGWLYWKKRLSFWKWRKHYTTGRPVLVRRTKR